MLDFLGDLRRTHMCGALRASDAGKKAVLMGWVNRRRDLGNLIFIDVRDRSGITQIVCDKERNPALHTKAEELRNEYVIAVIGTVKQRDGNTFNKNIPTGEIEMIADELRILNESKQPPFLPGDTVLPNEEMRLQYRYIDLRRDAMQRNIELRHKVAIAIRSYLSAQGFFEIETPFMTRSTPEGRARLSCSQPRAARQSFYALPQSPQLFKQILMISGFDKLFPDRALLPRRRSARRPAAGIHADRSGNVVSAAGAGLGGGRRISDRGFQSCWTRNQDAVSAHELRPSDSSLRQRQA